MFVKKEQTKEQLIKESEKQIQKMFDDSLILTSKGELNSGKDKCLQAFEKLVEFKSKNFDYLNTE